MDSKVSSRKASTTNKSETFYSTDLNCPPIRIKRILPHSISIILGQKLLIFVILKIIICIRLAVSCRPLLFESPNNLLFAQGFFTLRIDLLFNKRVQDDKKLSSIYLTESSRLDELLH